MSDQQPTIGRIVHYMLGAEARPAIVVRVWPDAVNLQVFTDGTNDLERARREGYALSAADFDAVQRGVIWRTSVHHDDERRAGTWHWPPRT